MAKTLTAEDIAKLPYRRCVGVMVVNAEGKVFVGQRVDRDTDAWQMPQGGIDAGEDLRTAALRELAEETGITSDLVEIEAETGDWLPYDLPHRIVPNIWKGRYRGQEQKWVLLRFKGEDAQIDIEQPDQEFSRWKWMAPEDLLAHIVPFKRDVYAKVLDAFRDRL
ncbi:RNA pyrophosphohydrolase [Thalassorhabdomicrobium marinisediminis]|uniref:RNA pyrophosphohydrolase n=1 Tax=Thalassorhabdomicrobium marinisediminis TaxID=2170577 RepID=A0A2T7FVS6_9RHOB|nr:RNA pyrophosphohydrolase [Thalassorhabdomicrobium marinisediminis]PVA06257.1 RNA pyrophosphohydrolase [Thalassorhabdomicrobium marinisediminis]